MKEKESEEGHSLSSARSLVSSLPGLVFTPKPSASMLLPPPPPGKKPVAATQSHTARDDVTVPGLETKENVADARRCEDPVHAEAAEKDTHEGKRGSFQLSSLFGGKASAVTNESSEGASGEVEVEREREKLVVCIETTTFLSFWRFWFCFFNSNCCLRRNFFCFSWFLFFQSTC